MVIFASIAGALCTVSFIPQLRSALSGDMRLTLSFMIVYCIGVINWGLYGLTIDPIGWPLVVISFLQMAFVIGLIILKVKHGK